MKIRTHLVLLVLLALLPVLLFAGGATVLAGRAQQGISDLSLKGTAAALSSAIDERISSIIMALTALAIVEDFTDLEEVHRRATRIVESDGAWHAIALTTPDGQHLLNTYAPYGKELPSLAQREYIKRAIATRKPAISGLIAARMSGRPIVAVAVPVLQGDSVRFVLVGALNVESLSRLLNPSFVPERWTAAVIDEEGTIIGRSRTPERFVGEKAVPGLVARIAQSEEAVFQEVTKEGDPAHGAFRRSKLTGWTVVLGAPAGAIHAPYERALWWLVSGGLALAFLGTGVALFYGQRATAPLLTLARSAAAVERGERPTWHPTVVSEVNGVAQALLETMKRLDEERRTVTTLHEIGSALAAELDLQRLIQRLTDEATALTGAKFGAYFHADVSETGPALKLYTLSGAAYEDFARFGTPGATKLFGPTFRGEGVIRIDDVAKDPRYGHNPPHHGMPKGHLPVRSYLAVPVVSRTGEVLGGLFFGHPEPAVFTERHERQMVSVAAQAAVGIDNARLFLRAQRAIALRDEFLSIASHELKTPLAALRLQVQAYDRKLRADAPERSLPLWDAAYPRMLRQVARLSSLIEQLLDVSRLTAGQIALQRERFDFAALVGEVVDQFDSERERVGCEIRIDAPPLEGEWDRSRVEQIIANLLGNALKYGPGKPIEVSLSSEGEAAVLRVRDHGIGISVEDQKRIFGRFERAVSERNYGGLGLGLWIAQRLAVQHGGSISVESAPGDGALFTVRLPSAAASMNEQTEEGAA